MCIRINCIGRKYEKDGVRGLMLHMPFQREREIPPPCMPVALFCTHIRGASETLTMAYIRDNYDSNNSNN